MASVYWENLDVVGERPLRVKARVTLLTTQQGGRQVPITKNYRPNHNLDGPDYRVFHIGQLELEDGEWMPLGETRELFISFLNVRGLAEKLALGTKLKKS